MKKLHLFKRTLLLLALIVGCVNYGWAEDELFYTLTPASGTNNAYASSCDVAISGITWNVVGNSQLGDKIWGIGGKSISNQDRTIYSKTQMSSAISKIEMEASSESGITVNSVKLIVANDADFTNKIDEVSVTFSSGNTMTIKPSSPKTEWDKNAYYKFVFNVTVSGNKNKKVTFSGAKFYKIKSAAFTITPVSNDDDMGTVALSGTTITATPASGYRVSTSTPYEVTSGTATVVDNGDNTFSVNPTSDCTVTINFEAIPTYTVTFNAEGGSCVTKSAKEAIGGGGVTLPAATIGLDGWVFAGWAEDATASTTTRPTLYKSGRTYYPTANTTLHAVYTLDGVNYEKYQRATTLEQITSASQIAIVNASKILDNNLGGVDAPEETDGFIDEPSSDYIWTLSGDNTDGFTLTNGGNTIGTAESLPSTSGNLQLSSNHNNWLFVESTNGTNNFVVRNKELNSSSQVGSIEYYSYSSNWKIYFLSSTSYTGNSSVASKIYVPVSTVFNSNPTQAIITPVVSFNSSDAKTLYLDGTTTYTNAASVTKVAKPVTGYRSSDEDVATVDASGVVNAVGIGTATITAYLDAELGVHKAAQATYDVVVKTTTTIAGLKTIDNNSGVAFAADLTDAVVTYVSGDYAYIQDASAAILVNKSKHGLIAGQKINGAVSGTVKTSYSIDQLTAIDLNAAAVTEDGIIPAAEVKTLAQIKAGDYDGKLVTVNGATVKTGMDDATSGGVITDDDNETTFNIIAPNKLTLKATEIGNFTGFVSTYVNGPTTTYRLNLYDASQYQKTRNVETAQTLSFEGGNEAFDEVTSALSAFKGKSVEGAHTAVTYSKVDASSIIGDFDTETGALTLNGACGTATITASAAAGEVVEAGVTTPYLAASESYTITVSPRYMVTFSVNGVETVLRQATSGADIAVPTPAACGDYTFVGWSTSTVDPTDDEPSMADLGATVTPENNNGRYYAVFAQEGISGSGGSYTLDYANESDIYNKSLAYATETNLTASDGGEWVIHAYSQINSTYGLQINTNRSASIKVPTCPSNITSIVVTCKLGAVNGVGFSSTASGSSVISVSDGTSQTLNLTGKKMTDGYIIPVNGNAIITNIVVNYGPIITYSDYRTSLPTVEVTITDAQYATFCYERELDVEGTGVTAYTASANGEGKAVTLTKISDGIIPANTGVILFAESAGNYEINVSDTDKDAIDGNELVGVTTRTQIPESADGKYNYILSKKDDVVGFYRASGAYLLPNRAYLSTSKRDAAAREFMAIMFDEGETTSLREVRGLKADVRGEFFNLNGQRVATPVKGNIYIVNGKKVMFK